jgi:glycosyltransferase involved in cell wall biosynthesis
MTLSLIIPAHNEEKRILTSLSELTQLSENRDYEIIVVCNGCTDKTADIVRKKYAKNNKIKICELQKPEKGGAILYGFEKAHGEILGFVDADNPFGVNAIEKLVSEIKNGLADCTIVSKWYLGSRFSNTPESFRRKLGSLAWNLLVRLLLGLKVHDTQGGTKFMSKAAFDAIDKNFICKGFEFDVELLSKLKQKGFRIKEIHTPLRKPESTTFRASRIPAMFLNLIRLWLKSI